MCSYDQRSQYGFLTSASSQLEQEYVSGYMYVITYEKLRRYKINETDLYNPTRQPYPGE